MSEWSLPGLLINLHEEMQQRLERVRNSLGHPGTKGDASEEVWLKLLQTYLPKRYQAEKAHIVDSNNEFSEQIDVVIFDRQYSPLIFHCEGKTILPAESVYAVFETKQEVNAAQISYAQAKVASVRRLHRTTLPIPNAGGVLPAKDPIPIYGGILCLESGWNPALGEPLLQALNSGDSMGKLDLGCIAAHGYFSFNRRAGKYDIFREDKALTAFLFKLISELQLSGTVPMIDVQAYARWLSN